MGEDIANVVKWIAVGLTAFVVVVAVASFFAGRASVTALDVRRDSIRTVFVAKIDTVTVYVDQANASHKKSSASKSASDAADAKIEVVDPTTIALRITPSAPPTIHVVPPELVTDLITLRRTVADQAKTILDTRAALSHAQGALKTAVDLHAADSTRIAQLQKSQCDRSCKITLLAIGALAGVVAAK